MEQVIHAYHELLNLISTLQQQGKFTLPEASALFTHLCAMKTGIEEAHKAAGSSETSADAEELENTKVELMSTRIEADNLKRNYEDAVERIQDMEAQLNAAKSHISDTNDVKDKIVDCKNKKSMK